MRRHLRASRTKRKLEATEQLTELAAKAGMTLIEMAIAFVADIAFRIASRE